MKRKPMKHMMKPMIPMKKNMLTAGLMFRTIKDTTASMYELGKNRLLYTIDITSQNSVLYEFLHEHFQYADDILITQAKDDDDANEVEVLFETLWCQHMTYAGINHRDIAMINGIPCMLRAHGLGGGDKKDSTRNYRALTISTLRVNGYPEALKEMLREEYFKGVERNRAEGATKKKRYIRVFTPSVLDTMRIVKRTFENVYVPKEIKDQITVNVDNFMFRKRWFLDNAIPYHFGIMLYGPAGTGKTSLAQAIANYVPRSTIFYMNGDDIMYLPKLIKLMEIDQVSSKYPKVVIVEDIDCGFDAGKLSKRDKNEDDSEKTGLATLLNSLDGISAPFNTIFIFTTNHIEALDPALIRPGRIDMCLEIKPVCTETFKEFMKHHFGDDIKFPVKFKVKENFVTFAKLQTMVMNNCSIQEIVDYVNAYPKRSNKNESIDK